jgi:hypothetical protein
MADIESPLRDAFQQWNPAKYAFATDKQGVSISYTTYTNLANDISLGQLTTTK